jgi:hypothetical protein
MHTCTYRGVRVRIRVHIEVCNLERIRVHIEVCNLERIVWLGDSNRNIDIIFSLHDTFPE